MPVRTNLFLVRPDPVDDAEGKPYLDRRADDNVRAATQITMRWADLALRCGYYDQSHFINELRSFSGLSPFEFLQRTRQEQTATVNDTVKFFQYSPPFACDNDGTVHWRTAKEDPLGEALHFLRMSGVSYCRFDFPAPWGLLLPFTEGCARFHLAVSGAAILRTGREERNLQAGDLVLLPHGDEHSLADSVASPVAQLEDLQVEHQNERYSLFRFGGGGASTRLVCVKVKFDHPAAYQLIAQLPKIIHVSAENSHDMAWLDPILRFIASEAKSLRPGGDTVLTRLADILIIQTIRWWIEHQSTMQPGWLAALRDTQIGHAITLIHREPGRPWTVGSLASEVAMSRSSFAERFTKTLGEPVMHYVARWRMYMALTILRQENVDIGELAMQLGYTSEAAFNRTFKRVIGITPGNARRK